MKFKNIISVLGLGMAMVSCSDNQDFNTASGVTVQMADAVYEVRESSRLFWLPVNVTGNPDGKVRVRLKIEPVGETPALPFEERNGVWNGNYLVTSDVINIPADEKTAGVEIKLFDDRDENGTRTFRVTIESAEGAAIGSVNSTLVSILDNDNTPYGKLQGDWVFRCNAYSEDNGEVNWNVTVTGFDDDTPEYEKLLSINGLLGGDTSLDIDFMYDEETGKSTVEIVTPENIGKYKGSEYFWVFIGEIKDGNRVSYRAGKIRGEVSEDLSTITWEPDLNLVFLIGNVEMTAIRGFYELASNMVMTRE